MIGFMSLCDMPDDKFMPCEMAITEYSLRNGIIRHFHKFIDPGNMHDLHKKHQHFDLHKKHQHLLPLK
jgi:hypothetical protein